MKILKTTLATLLLGTSISMANLSEESVPDQMIQSPQADMPVAYHAKHHHKNMTKAQMMEASKKHIEMAEKMIGEIKDEKAKALAEVNLGNMKNSLAGYDKFVDADHAHLSALMNMCEWNMKKIEAAHKKDTKHQDSDKKKMEREAKKSAKAMKKEEAHHDMKKEEMKPEEKKEEKKEEPKKEEMKTEEKK